MIFLLFGYHGSDTQRPTPPQAASSHGCRKTAVTLSTGRFLPLTMTNIGVSLSPTDKIIDLIHKALKHPLSTELQSTAECHICHEPFISGNNPERPIALPCGHIFGEGCILKWVSPLSKNGIKNNCPLCRKPILQLGAQEPPRTHTRYSYTLALCTTLLSLLSTMCLGSLFIILMCTVNLVIMPCWLHLDVLDINLLVVAVLYFGACITLLYCIDHDSITRHAANV